MDTQQDGVQVEHNLKKPSIKNIFEIGREHSEKPSVLDKELSTASVPDPKDSQSAPDVDQQFQNDDLIQEAESVEELMKRSPAAQLILSKMESFVSEKISVIRQNLDESRQKYFGLNKEISTFSFGDESMALFDARFLSRDKLCEAHSRPLNQNTCEEKTTACKYSNYGCKETLVVGSLHEIDHYENCKYRPLACILHPLCQEIMPFHGYIPHLGKHFLVPIHSTTITTTVVLTPEDLKKPQDQRWTPKWFTAMDQHFFTMVVRKKEGLWSIWVWTLGSPEEADNFAVSVKIYKGFKSISETIPVHSIRVPAEEIESEKTCLHFTDETMIKLTDFQDHLFADFTIHISLRDDAKTLNSSIREKRLPLTNYQSVLHIHGDETPLSCNAEEEDVSDDNSTF